MAKLGINTGTTPNDGTGDTLLDAGVKINSNFDEVYGVIGDGSAVYTGIVTQLVAGDFISISTSFGSVTVTGLANTISVNAESLVVSGLSTLGVITGATSLEVGPIYGTTAEFSGNVTGGAFIGDGSNLTGLATTEHVVTESLVVSGVSTLGIITGANSLGIANVYTSFIYGDGNGLVNIPYSALAGVATYADNAGIATYSDNAGIATYSDNAGIATYATSAGVATDATYAISAGIATYSDTAGIATYATSAGVATDATYAVNAGVATYSDTSGIATYSSNAGLSTNATYATYSSNAGLSTNATYATYSTTAGIATYATYATYSSNAGLSTNATYATYSTTAGIATYADTAGIATYASSSGIATFATRAGVVTNSDFAGYADVAGISTYSPNAGVATYADTAGIATNAEGLTGTPNITVGQVVASNLSVSGVSTLGVVTGATYYGDGTNLTGVVLENTTQTFTQLVVTGVTTLGVVTGVQALSADNIYATSFYGDGSNVTGVIAEGSVGVSIGGSYVGAGFTNINTIYAGSVEGTAVGNGSTVNITITGLANTANINGDSMVITGVSTLGIITGVPSIEVTNIYGTEFTGNSASADEVKTQTQTLDGNYNVTFVDGDNGSPTNETVYTGNLVWNPFSGSLTGITSLNATEAVIGDATVTQQITSGIATFSSDAGVVGVLTAGSLEVTGVTTLGVVTSVTSIEVTDVYATTLYGDGSNLTGVVASGVGVTVQDGGVGKGTASILNFDSNLTVTDVSGGIATVTASAGSGSTANISADTLVVSGVSTLTNLAEVRSDDGTPGRVDYYCEVSNAHYTRIQAAPHAEYSGNATVTLPTTDGDIIVGDTASAISQNVNTSGIITAAEFYGDGSNLTGISAGSTANVSADTLVVSGVSTLGIITGATSLGVTDLYATTLYGDGSNLTGVGGGGSGFDVGYGLTPASSINLVGTGITQVNFVGVGYTVEVSGNIATVRNLAQGLEVIEVTSSGFAATVFAGAQMSYSATSNNANAHWFIEDYDGLTSIAIGYDTGNMAGGQLDEAGTYNIGIRAGTFFGLSERHNVSLTIEPFTLTMDTAFGNETSLLMWDELGNIYGMLASGGVVDYDGANYVIDRDNSNIGSASSHALFYSPSSNRMIGFRYNASENVDSYRYWTSVSDASDGTNVGSGNILDSDSGNLADQVLPENMLRATVGGGGTGGYWFPTGDRQNFLGGSHYLEITPSDATLDNFGTKSNGSWSYGFTLEDPWIVSGGAQQMLSPSTSAKGWHLFGMYSYTIGSSDYEGIMYGDFDSGPYSTSSGSEYTAIDGKVGLAGSTVQVYFNDSTDRYHIYIDGTQVFSSTSPATYMISGTTSEPVLRFGDTTLTNGGNTPIDEDEPVPWYTRIRDLWIDNSGVLGPSSFTAIGTFRDRNLETYEGYEYIDVYATLTGAGTSVKKGGVSLARGTVTFT
jgi:hypothetical protein